jgi:hypothetical protein
MEEKTVIQFTQEESDKVQALQEQVLFTTTKMGEIELEIYQLEQIFETLKSQKSTLYGEYLQLMKTQDEISKALKEKYGEGEYDISTNTFVPKK